MPNFHLAQVNIARMKAPLDDPGMANFFDYLAPVNALADVTRGFVWRFKTEAGDATSLRAYGDDQIIVNFSVWESVEALKNYVYKGSHGDLMRMRHQWFEKMAESHMAMWWVRAGHVPTWKEAEARLESLRQHGETPFAFTFRSPFPPPAA
jgi:hypothetical protein